MTDIIMLLVSYVYKELISPKSILQYLIKNNYRFSPTAAIFCTYSKPVLTVDIIQGCW